MPQLVKLQDELRETGFVIIGNHVQRVEKKKVLGLVRSMKVNFTVTSFGNVNVPNKGNGIPRAFLFNSKGELVEKGHPSAMKKTIHDLVAKEPHWLAAGREYKKLGSIVNSLKRIKVYGSLCKKLAKQSEKDGDVGEEAKYLLGRIRGHGNRLLEKAEESESDDAFGAYQLYSKVSMKWKGDEVGDKASSRLKGLKKDKDFQTEFKASRMAYAIRAEIAKLVPDKAGELKPEYGPNKRTAAKVKALFAGLKKRYPESSAAGAIKEELSEYGI